MSLPPAADVSGTMAVTIPEQAVKTFSVVSDNCISYPLLTIELAKVSPNGTNLTVDAMLTNSNARVGLVESGGKGGITGVSLLQAINSTTQNIITTEILLIAVLAPKNMNLVC